jgi:acyl-CoA synthetase (NDP forming)
MDQVRARFAPLFAPASIAVVGASSSGGNLANAFLRNLRTAGSPSRVYPVHPSAASIEGFPAIRALRDLQEPADYVYAAVGAAQTAALLDGAAGKVRFLQVISSGFAEAGEPALQDALLAACRAAGARLIGPNCLGIHAPAARASFVDRIGFEPGPIGVLSQSGGLGVDILRRGQQRGLRFSGLVTLGNCADIGPAELLDYYVADPATKIIGLYLEDVADGRGFFAALRRARASKPVVLLKGGRTSAGQRASASHTGALAQDDRLWQALARQTGTILVETLDGFLDALLLCQTLAARQVRPTRRVVLFGNGGGTSVLATDAYSRAGFEIPDFSAPTLARLDALKLPPGSSIRNPVDTPAGTLRQGDGAVARSIMEAFADEPGTDAVVLHLNMTVFLSYGNPRILPNIFDGALQLRTRGPAAFHFLLVLRSDGEAELEAEKQRYRAQAVAAGIPVFDELPESAAALRGFAGWERFLHARGWAAETSEPPSETS